MSATETEATNARCLGHDPLVEDGIDEDSMVYLVLPFVKTAREGVERLGKLIEKYGTGESNGIAFSDHDEVWYFETGAGHQWVAQRIPEDSYAICPNIMVIQDIDFDDHDNFMYAPTIRDFVEKNHLNPSTDGKWSFRDIFGKDIEYWHKVETDIQRFFKSCGFSEFRLPVLEKTAVFKRGIGETTDIVEKEMFTFIDSQEHVSLRPEGTAALMRAYIENNLYNPPGIKKYYYLGNMFRRERPQKGRFRQFTQIGVEVLECDAPLLDAEIIGMLYKTSEILGFSNYVSIEINSIGCPVCRPKYKEDLVRYFDKEKDKLCDDCKRRLSTNPLRILDCKIESCKNTAKDAPSILNYLCDTCSSHFEDVKEYLIMMNIPFKINERMVRGLDYYIRTAFELVTDKLGAASAVGAGGRYDGLVKSLGGKDTAGIGFAIGLDRVVELLKEVNPLNYHYTDVFILVFDKENLTYTFNLVDNLRNAGYVAEYDYNTASMKSQMKKADKSQARYAVILGSNEVKENKAAVKDLISGEQFLIELENVFEYLKNKLI